MVQRLLEKPSADEDILDIFRNLNVQSNPLGLPSITYRIQSSFKNRVRVPMPLQPSKNYMKWHTLVEWYSSYMLTMENDKLVAFSGVAKISHQALDSDYLSGLWRNNLPNELIWRVSRVESDNVRSTSRYRSPSWPWSWPSVDTQVIYNFVGRELYPVIDVIDCHIDHLSLDPCSRDITSSTAISLRKMYLGSEVPLVLPHTGMQLYAMLDVEPEATSGEQSNHQRCQI